MQIFFKKFGKENCCIWTKADNRRARAIISLCKLKRFFKGVIFDDKTDFNKSIKTLKKLTKEKSLIIYENNKEFFKNQRVEIVETIKDKNFDISPIYKVKITIDKYNEIINKLNIISDVKIIEDTYI